MKRQIHRLSAKAVEMQKRAGYFADGGGLYLAVGPTRTKSWIFRYTLEGRAREMGLGSLNAVSLAQAREAARECRHQLHEGRDPIEARNARRTENALTRSKAMTFAKCAEAYIAAHRAGWSNPKHADQWENTLDTYAGPIIGEISVQAVDTALVLRVLEPIWTKKHETATRVRGRIEHVLDWAKVRGYRDGENPARWKGHLQKLLAAVKRNERVQHHAALPYDEIGAFMQDLRAQSGTPARALELCILAAARTAEIIGAKPQEFDLDKALWTVPAGRMKAGKEHRVPLSPQAVVIVREALKAGGEYVFPGRYPGKPLSNMAMLELLKRMDRGDLTVHGFRSTFKDWAADVTSYPNIVSEMALAHAVSDAVEAAYRRGDLFDKRRRLMAEWAKYCATPRRAGAGAVIAIKRAAQGALA